ncbi:MAG: histidine--tRNA ligase [Acidobacteria bacterium]|nr:MAG: histidine--tRNA ligase [Acidobacteriota bacterium]
MSEGAAKKERPRSFQAIRGVRDLLPDQTSLWNFVERIAHETFATFGFGEIRLPLFERTDLFARSIGEDTDVVSKEMYTFLDPPAWLEILEKLGAVKDVDRTATTFTIKNHLPNENFIAEVLSLRPEATASACRAYIEHNMQQLPQPVKLYYMGPMFRRERPQKGRYRQFYQIGAEVLGGSDAPAIDAEVIEMVMTFFDRLGLEGVQLHINSIGDKNCRPKYVELLREELQKVKDKLGPDSRRRIDTNPLRVLDSKLESEQETIEKLPRITQHLCDSCRDNYDEVKRQLAIRGINYSQNFRLVRGLDYYMRTTFEITAKGLGSQNAVCGGGRYDGLLELLGGPPTKGIGFAIGEDRLILSLQESGKAPAQQGRDVYIAWMGERAQATAIRAAKDLRKAGFSVELPPVEQKFGKALGQADKLGAKYALILGDNEVSEGLWTLKMLADGSQAKFTEPDLLEHLRKQKALSS